MQLNLEPHAAHCYTSECPVRWSDDPGDTAQHGGDTDMAKTFLQMVADARKEVNVISPQEAKKEIEGGGATVIDVREPDEVAESGTVPGARNIPRGVLEIKADTELPMKDPELQDRDQKVIIACGAGGQAALSAKALKDMGFTDVSIIDGGVRGWKEAGFETAAPKK
jgi:rhodanese-related sulfurtransferase